MNIVRLASILKSWEGTPYMEGCCCRGTGVDCRYLAIAVWDELHGVTADLPQRYASRRGTQDRREAIKIIRSMTDRWPNEIVTSPEPGDICVAKRPVDIGQFGRPTHVLIVGANFKTLWHSHPTVGVCMTSWGAWQSRIVRIYRSKERSKW